MFDQKSVEAIIEHMNVDHADAVLLYVKAYAPDVGAEVGGVVSATMTNLDAQGIGIRCVTRAGDINTRILFATTGISDGLNSLKSARGVLVAMAKVARQKIDSES